MENSVLQVLIQAKDEASQKLHDIGSKAKEIGIGMAAVGGLITGALYTTVTAATEAQQKMASVQATLDTMGEAGAKAKASILEAADATLKLGFDNEEAAQSITKLFQRTGDAKKAIELNNIAMDLARAKNIDLSSAATLVGQVLSGNGRVLKAYGIDLKEVGDPLEALDELHKKVGGQAQAFANTYAGSSEILQQQIGELKEKIGTVLLPFLTKLVSAMVPILEKVMAWIDQNPKLTETILKITAVLGPLLVVLPALVAAITAILSPVGLVIAAFGLLVAAGVLVYENWDTIKEKSKEAWEKVKEKIEGVLAGLKLAMQLFVDIFTGNWVDAWQKIKQIIDLAGPQVQAAFAALWDGVAAKVTAAFETVKGVIKSGINWVIEQVNLAINAINGATLKVAGALHVSAPQISNIPKLAQGGIVTRPTVALVGEAGPEAVIPLRGGSAGVPGGVSVTVNLNGTILAADSEAVARKIGDLIMRKFQASVRI